MRKTVKNDFTGAIYWVQSFSSDCNVNVTSLKIGNFNVYEGYQVAFTIKIKAPQGKVFSDTNRKSKVQTFQTNSTWLDDFEYSTSKELKQQLNEYFNYIIEPIY